MGVSNKILTTNHNMSVPSHAVAEGITNNCDRAHVMQQRMSHQRMHRKPTGGKKSADY